MTQGRINTLLPALSTGVKISPAARPFSRGVHINTLRCADDAYQNAFLFHLTAADACALWFMFSFSHHPSSNTTYLKIKTKSSKKKTGSDAPSLSEFAFVTPLPPGFLLAVLVPFPPQILGQLLPDHSHPLHPAEVYAPP